VGTFRAAIEIGDAEGNRFEVVEALVDTGASYTWVPSNVLERLGVPPQARWEFEIAGGQVIERDVAETKARYENETRTTIVVFGDEGSLPLLGAYTLEGFRLAADPVNRRLIRVRGLAMAGAATARQRL
jgi:clan AA aspartic protease